MHLEFTAEQRDLQSQLREYFENLVADVEASDLERADAIPATSAGWGRTDGWASGGPSSTAAKPGGH